MRSCEERSQAPKKCLADVPLLLPTLCSPTAGPPGGSDHSGPAGVLVLRTHRSSIPLGGSAVCLVVQSRQTLCDPMDCSPPGSSVHGGVLQARILEWVAMSSSRGSSQPRG